MERVTTIYLVRHGETDYNRNNVYQGTLDIPLNAVGRAQAAELSAKFREVAFDVVFSSPLRRAVETAKIIAGEEEVIVVPELSELSYGSWQGLSRVERQENDPELDTQWRDVPWQVRFPRGETLEVLHTRVARAIDQILHRHSGKTILLSGHGHVNRIILTMLTDIDRDQFWEIQQPNGCCYRVSIRETASDSHPPFLSSPIVGQASTTTHSSSIHSHVTYEYLS